MLLIIGFLLTGILIGAFVKHIKGVKSIQDKTITIAIVLLLFFLGLNIGKNNIIVENLHKFGWHALILTLFILAFTIVFTYLLYKYFFKSK
jgi:Kef-type K+ transport system membrane component KefB